ncbi:MAG: glycosyltransferase family 2 protein [Candidatus Abawacabacteria bacterium]|nr:glycosyltransferase family 2 protein [Candidatus Abawacabacteria bacterium]
MEGTDAINTELNAVVLPALNEAGHIQSLIQKLKSKGYVVIVVDDGSTDNTQEIAEKAGAIVLRHAVNCGAGAATQTGLTYAYQCTKAPYVITCDADGQHEVADIDTLVSFIEEQKKDVVFGSRFLQENHVPLLRRLANMVGNVITFALSGIYLSDSQSGLKVFSRKALQYINITANGFEFCSEIIREVSESNLSYAEYPIHVYYSKETLSKGQNLSTGFVTVFKLIVRSLMRR